MYETINFEIEGTAPLLMHSGQLANPFNDVVRQMKEITAKRKKTDTDLIELSRLEFLGSLYLNEKGTPVIPGTNIEAMLESAAKQSRMGRAAKAGLMSDGNWPLQYEGPKDAGGLWDDKRFVDVRGVKLNGKVTVMRTRPIFRNWSMRFSVQYLPDVLNRKQVQDLVEVGGRLVGLCDYKPKFGRFTVKKVS